MGRLNAIAIFRLETYLKVLCDWQAPMSCFRLKLACIVCVCVCVCVCVRVCVFFVVSGKMCFSGNHYSTDAAMGGMSLKCYHTHTHTQNRR